MMCVVKNFFHTDTSTLSYVITDKEGRFCCIIDPVADYYDGEISYKSANEIIKYIKSKSLTVSYILETHVHAEHLTAGQYIKDICGGKIAIGENVYKVVEIWKDKFGLTDLPEKYGFDILLKEGDTLKCGMLDIKVINTPGHTPSCVSYIVDDCMFVGDTLFAPEAGTARADFPGGGANILYDSIQKIFSYPSENKVFLCHYYGNELSYFHTIADHQKNNIMINDSISKEQYIKTRTDRDKTLKTPKALLHSLQFNMIAGNFYHKNNKGVKYFRIPITEYR